MYGWIGGLVKSSHQSKQLAKKMLMMGKKPGLGCRCIGRMADTLRA